MKPVLILGARSDMARAIAEGFAERGHPIQLAARQTADLETLKSDLELRHRVAVSLHTFDALATETHGAFIAALPELPEIAVCAVGVLGVQAEAETDPTEAARILRSNFEGPALMLERLAADFATRGTGTLVGISSVAGERGRASNYVYGAAKAGFTAYLSGLRNRLAKRGVAVITVQPGYVRTQMTEGLDLPGPLTADPPEVAQALLRAVDRGRDVIFVRPIWRLVMAIICAIPERIFKRLSL